MRIIKGNVGILLRSFGVILHGLKTICTFSTVYLTFGSGGNDMWLIFILSSLSFFVMGEFEQIGHLFILHDFNWFMRSKKYCTRMNTHYFLPLSSELVFLSFNFLLGIPLIRSPTPFALVLCMLFFLARSVLLIQNLIIFLYQLPLS